MTATVVVLSNPAAEDLRNAGLTSGVPARYVAALGKLALLRRFAPGESILREGFPPEGLYIIRTGKAQLSISNGSKATGIREVGSGEVLGVSSAVSGKPVSITATAEASTETWFLPRPEFIRIMARCPQLCMQVALLLSKGVQQAYAARVDLQISAR
jgi:CRP-like cAMP-binding protein